MKFRHSPSSVNTLKKQINFIHASLLAFSKLLWSSLFSAAELSSVARCDWRELLAMLPNAYLLKESYIQWRTTFLGTLVLGNSGLGKFWWRLNKSPRNIAWHKASRFFLIKSSSKVIPPGPCFFFRFPHRFFHTGLFFHRFRQAILGICQTLLELGCLEIDFPLPMSLFILSCAVSSLNPLRSKNMFKRFKDCRV